MSGSTEEEATEGALESNVEQLMRRAPATPQMNPEARARTLQALLAAQKAKTAPRPPLAEVIALPRPRHTAREAMLLGAVAVAAGCLGLFMSSDVFRPTLVHENTGRGPMTVSLLDGSKAVLDAGAKIEERGKRSVRVDHGAVIFDVAHGSGMRVDAGPARVNSLGTAFLVRAEEGRTSVAVARGKVEVEGRGGDAVVLAGQQSIVAGEAAPETKPAPRLSHLFGFARKAEGEPLDERAVEGDSPRRTGTLIARDPRWGMERPLEIRDMTIDVHVEDGVARTTIDQTFFNADVRQLEGVYQLPLPHGAAISRLGMYVDGQLMEAAVVDRDRGRDIYEGIVYQRRDPALLEWMSGNSFKMRVFPLPGRTEKRIFLSYTQTLEHLYDTERLVVPIPPVDLPAQHVKLRVRVAGGSGVEVRSPSHDVAFTDEGDDRVGTFEASSYTLGDDFVISMRSEQAAADMARSFEEDGARYIGVRARPDLSSARGEAAKAEVGGRWVVLYDTSASRTVETLAAQRRFVRELASDLEDEDQLTVLSVDHVTRRLTAGAQAVGDLDRSALDRSLEIAGENAAGDLRLDRAFEEAAKLLSGSGGTVVYVGDGTPTGGVRSAQLLADKLPENVRFAGVALGDSTDMRVLDAIADERRGYATTIGLGDDLAHRAFDVVAALRTPCLRGIQATVLDESGTPVNGATAHLMSRRACDGEQVDVVARVPSGAKPQTIRIGARIDGSKEIFHRDVPVAAPRVGASYLPRLWASREVESLLASNRADDERSSIVELASKHVLATPYTSLLVLENDAMYKQYGVEKREPTGFAVYRAPKKIDVRYEPMGSESTALDSSWDLVHRLPTQVFSDPNIGTGQGFGSGSGRLGGRHREVEERKSEAPARVRGRVMNATPAASAAPDTGFDARIPAFMPKLTEAPVERQAAKVTTRQDRAQTKGEASNFGMIGLLDTMAVSQDFLQSAAFGGAYPMAFVSSSDPRLDDLTELAPSLLVQDFDLEREVIAAAAGAAKTKRSPEALEALRKARKAIPDATYDVTDRRGTARVSVGATTRWDTPRLGEVTEYDGNVITSTYSELDLAVGRRVDGAGPWLLASDLAFLPPSEAALEQLDVSLTDDGAVRIEAPRLRGEEDGQPRLETLELRFDDAGRIREIRWLDSGTSRRTTIEHEHGGDVVVSHPDGRVVRFRHAGARTAPPVAAVTTRIEVPVTVPARIDARLSTLGSGSDAWIAAQREKLAACAALADDGCGRAALTSLLSARGMITRGEAVLASRALVRGSDDDAKKLLASLEESDPVRRSIAAAREWDGARRRSAFAGLNLPKGPLATWTTYRSILLDLENEQTVTPALVARVETFVKDPSARDELRFLLTKSAADRSRWHDQKLGQSVWSLLSGDPDLGFIADRQRALLDSWSNPSESATLLVRSFDAALDRGLAPTLDWQTREIIKRGRGDVGYRLFWASWRKRMVDRGSAAQIVGFVRSVGMRPEEAGTNGLYDDLAPLITRFDAASDAGTDARIELARQLLAMDRPDSVDRVLRPALNVDEPSPEALDIASLGAEKLGKLDDAAKLVQRAIHAAADREVPMDQVRARYGRLLALHVKGGDHAGPAGYATALAAAVQTARSWRREDPDNADVDLNVAAALDRLGSPEEAERQLYSIIDRHPGEGDGFAKVAAAMEARGNFDEALALWEQASSVEATNPTWLLRKAQLLRARSQPGDLDAARKALTKIHDGKWQDRFRQQTHEALQLLNATKK